MAELSITHTEDANDWHVWIQLEKGHPERQNESFIIGSGETKEAAVLAAITDLDQTLVVLRASPATIKTRQVY